MAHVLRGAAWRALIAAGLLALAIGPGCGDTEPTGSGGEGGGGVGGEGGAGGEPVGEDWNREMTLEELIAVAEALGLNLVEEGESSEVTKEAVVDALEDATGCGCFGALCGTGECGHECGSCEGESETCFAGLCEAPHTCKQITVSATLEDAVLRNDTETLKFRYEAEVEAGGDLEKLKIFSNTKVDEPLGPGTYDLRHKKLGECSPCIAAYKGCSEDGSCAFAFVARAGVVEIESISGESFKGNFHELKFDAAYEDPKTGVFTVLEQFDPVCVEQYAFDSKLEEVIIEPQSCDPEGNGTTVGSKLRDFTLENCLGDQVNFHVGCDSKALWLVAAAGW